MRPTGSSAGPSSSTITEPPTVTGPSSGDAATGLPSVALIGDSITEMSVAELTGQLAGRWDLSIDGRSGYTIADQLPAARALADDQPTQVVINLGSNDVARVTSSDQPRSELEEMVGLFPTARCVHLVTVNEGITWNGLSFAVGASAVNEAIADIAAADTRVTVVDWSGAVSAADDDGRPDGAVLSDDVHPTDVGRRLLAELYDQALSSCPAG
jgi:lysophospholipase L1-like esterase